MATRAADLSWDETLDRPAQIMARDTVKPVLIRAGTQLGIKRVSLSASKSLGKPNLQ
ncbi:hypothetical protein [Microcoleus sp. FACHB-68]|uniref:hypothetical protein n=1 Tax=Microcoleus sp. FACHB-68 TaxID=2692826 RepID=UPI00168967C6|nr:hypothetical protein [Microcoleus sp. FACHB-68]MBD1937999.1 hypothetical protein [Microcoleus sp. FACHB-68]